MRVKQEVALLWTAYFHLTIFVVVIGPSGGQFREH